MKRLSTSLGAVIAVLGVLFVGRELLRHRDEAMAAVGHADLLLLVLALVLGLAGFTVAALGWWRCLVMLEVRRPRLDTVRRFFLGELGKYVPGGVWAVVGRAEQARRAGISGSVAYASTVLSLGLNYLAAMLTAGLALAAGAGRGGEGTWIQALALLPLGVLALHPRIVGFVLGLARRVTRRPLEIPTPPWRTSVLLLLWHVPAWIAVGAATWLVAVALTPGSPRFRDVLFAATLAWVIGFLAVPVPSGIGVREAVFVAAASGLLTAGIAAAVAIVTRVLFVLVDVVGAGLTALLAAGRRVRAPASRPAQGDGADG